MSIIKDTFFGGAEKNAAKQEAKNIQLGIDFQREQSEIGRNDIRDAIGIARNDIEGGTSQAISDINPYDPNSGLSQLQRGPSQAAQTLNTGAQSALNMLSAGRNAATDKLQRNFLASQDILNTTRENALRESNQGFNQGIGAYTSAGNKADAALNSALAGAQSDLNPFISAGTNATNLQAALSGALGREAQQAAYDDYLASPGQDFLRQEQERAITRNASATGGLRGSNVLEELQSRAAGRAALDFDNAYNRLSGLSSMGGQSANNLAGIRSNIGSNLANSALTVGQGVGSLAGQRGAYNAGIEQNLGGQLFSNRNSLGQNSANLDAATYNNMGNLLYSNAGNLSDITLGQSSAISGLLQNAKSNTSNLNANQGVNLANLQQALGTGLANIATGTGSQVAQLYGAKGQALGAGILGQADALRGTTTGFLNSKTGGSILSKIGIPGY